MADKMLPPLVLELRAKASELIAEVRTAATETEKAAATTKKAATEAESAAAKTVAAGEEASAKSSTSWSKFMGVSKAAAVGVVGATAVVGVESLKMAGEFQSSMTLLQTAGGEQAKNMQTVSSGILSLARATGTSTEQLSEGMYTVEKAGFQGAAGLNVLKAAAEGAKSENVDLSTATNALTSVMMSYHLKASDAVSVQNMLVAGSGKAKTSMQEYAGSLSTVIPIASAAGVGFDQVAGAIATLTQHGTSAQEATQELSNTIRNLQAPNAVAQKAMQQLGLSVNDVTKGLSDPSVGLQGTIEKITGAIRDHMGPAGTVVVDAFNKSASATKDLQTMIGKMPPQLASLSKGLLDGSVSVGDYTKAAKGFGGQAGAMGGQFGALYKSADGFNSLLKSGTTDQQTAAAALKNMMGGATGLNTALMLSGESSKYFADATKEVSSAGKKAGSDISTWGQTQKTFGVQMGRLKEDVQTAAIVIGTKLLPPVQAFVGFLANHPAVLVAFAAVITGVLLVAATAYFAKMVKGAAENVVSFAKMIAAGVRWVAAQAVSVAQSLALWAMYAGEWIADQLAILAAHARAWITGMTEWVAGQATSIGESLSLWAMYAGEWIAKQAAALGTWVAEQATQFAGWVAKIATQTAAAAARWTAYAVKWVAEQGAAAATWVATQGAAFATWLATQAAGFATAAAAGAAWIAEHIAMAGVAVVQYGIMAAAAIAAFVAENAATLGIAGLIALLIGAVVWLATHWSTAWNAIAAAATWVYQNVIKPIAGFIIDVALKPIEAYLWVLKTVWGAVWDGIKTAVVDVWNFLKPIFEKIGNGIGNIVSGAKAVGGFVGKVGNLLGFDNGGVVPGSVGAPMLAVVHGGEVVLSRDMLAGKQAPPDQLVAGAKSANGYKSASSAQAALAGASPAPSASASSSRGGGAPSVTVNVQTNANPSQIAAAMGWELRKVS